MRAGLLGLDGTEQSQSASCKILPLSHSATHLILPPGKGRRGEQLAEEVEDGSNDIEMPSLRVREGTGDETHHSVPMTRKGGKGVRHT